MNNAEYGRRVKDCRQTAGWSQEELARAVGDKWSQATVWSVENGTRPLRLTEAVTLAKVFGLSLEVFIGGSATSSGCPRCERVVVAIEAAAASLRQGPSVEKAAPTVATVADSRKLLTIDEVSEMTGIAVGTLRWWRATGAQGVPQARKVGGRVLYSRADVDAFIEGEKP